MSVAEIDTYVHKNTKYNVILDWKSTFRLTGKGIFTIGMQEYFDSTKSALQWQQTQNM